MKKVLSFLNFGNSTAYLMLIFALLYFVGVYYESVGSISQMGFIYVILFNLIYIIPVNVYVKRLGLNVNFTSLSNSETMNEMVFTPYKTLFLLLLFGLPFIELVLYMKDSENQVLQIIAIVLALVAVMFAVGINATIWEIITLPSRVMQDASFLQMLNLIISRVLLVALVSIPIMINLSLEPLPSDMSNFEQNLKIFGITILVVFGMLILLFPSLIQKVELFSNNVEGMTSEMNQKLEKEARESGAKNEMEVFLYKIATVAAFAIILYFVLIFLLDILLHFIDGLITDISPYNISLYGTIALVLLSGFSIFIQLKLLFSYFIRSSKFLIGASVVGLLLFTGMIGVHKSLNGNIEVGESKIASFQKNIKKSRFYLKTTKKKRR